MTLLAQISFIQNETIDGLEFRIPYRRFETPGQFETPCQYKAPDRAGAHQLDFTITLSHPSMQHAAAAELQAVASFLIDTTYGTVSSATLTRMIGHYFFTMDPGSSGGSEADTITISVSNSSGDRASTNVIRPEFEIERTAFGAAHILHEDDILGLYILEIAPHSTIPAHCHRVMRESELILDDGLLQQGRPVARGTAFTWPLGYVHAYCNPTGQPRRILCIDSPRFMPEDEVPLMAALVPLAPSVNYLA
jgi:hypothetical protein